jgi:hypothetical protein
MSFLLTILIKMFLIGQDQMNLHFWFFLFFLKFKILKRIVQYSKETQTLLQELFLSNNPKWELLFKTDSSFFNLQVFLKKVQIESDELFVGFDPLSHFFESFKERFEKFGLVFRNSNENYFGITWNPNKFKPSEFNIISNSIGMKPNVDSNEVVPNVEEIISDVKKMGEGLIQSIKLEGKIIFSK